MIIIGSVWDRVHIQVIHTQETVTMMKTIIIVLIFAIFYAKTDSKSNMVTRFASKLRKAVSLSSGEDSTESYESSTEANIEISDEPQAKIFLPLGCQEGQTFCENPAGYPSYEYLRKIAENLTEVEKLILFTNNARYSALTGQGLIQIRRRRATLQF